MSTVQNVSPTLLDSVNGSKAAAATQTADTQDRFLKLLVTQMKNQDPLNPLDNAQVTSQMAQLSTVTGIEKLNSTMSGLIGSVQASQALQASSAIGREVQLPGNSLALNNGAASPFIVELPSSAEKVSAQIHNSAGVLVREIALGALPAGNSNASWDGLDNTGAKLPDGHYKLTVQASQSGKTVDVSTQVRDVVTGVANTAQGVELLLSRSGSTPIGQVQQIF
ncbi:flagellar hook assembly protein FlgD [Pseudomethylobacillus aquaticus]|uniref:Basal-body rod modification protein FlgD n=1 Tax=Pseudomethylobacillus aquaticus TaxID=2676064 RepID=A0A3N0V0U0_9PROT|nr:flagellar hook assembly protein FlgD [Pseudomethylobacillus aquaticus]ROH86141.1 flagellar hook assembly protein FlgD [Pseudomethylobacillus aquaticus]